MPNILATLVLTGLLVAAPVAQGTDEPQDERIAQLELALATAAGRGASGMLLVTVDDRLYFQSAFGSASCTKDEPMTPEHVFMIGSITKELTQVLAYVLEERGHFSLADRIGERLPGLEGPLGEATIEQVVRHTGGLPDLVDANGKPVPYSIDYDYEPVTKAELLRRASLAEPIAAPGEKEEYANLGYQLLAAMYEETTGVPYPELLRRYIYEPAGMTDTGYWFEDADQRPFADGCLAGGAHWGNPIDDERWGPAGPSWNLMGAGGLLSTAASLQRFFIGIGDDVYFESAAQAADYRAGRMVESEKRGQRMIGSAGSNGIFWSIGYWADRDRFNLVLLTNRADHPAEGELFREIMLLFPSGDFSEVGRAKED